MTESPNTSDAVLTVDDLLARRGEIVDLLPADMSAETCGDAAYHAQTREEWIERNQIAALRNMRFHEQAVDFIRRDLRENSAILELASGVGFDAALFCRTNSHFRCYVMSEISPTLLEYARRANPELADKPVVFCCLDANRLRLAGGQFDAVFMIAALHHFADIPAAIREIDRVAKPGATIVFGIEPNRLWLGGFSLLKPIYRSLLPGKEHSQADEKARGFQPGDFTLLASTVGWRVEKLVPVWFFAGLLHYGLEFLFRLLRLKKRIRLPRLVEKFILLLDDLFFCLPHSEDIAWHYTVVFENEA